MHPTDDLIPLLKKLRLSGVLTTLDLRVRQAADQYLSPQEFLYRVLHDELERHDAKQVDLRVRRASFEHAKTLEDFDFTFNPQVPRARVIDLATCAFVERHRNVLLLGKTGVGKSHLAQALGHRACLAGHQVLYTSAHQMLTMLRAARADASHDRKMLPAGAVAQRSRRTLATDPDRRTVDQVSRTERTQPMTPSNAKITTRIARSGQPGWTRSHQPVLDNRALTTTGRRRRGAGPAASGRGRDRVDGADSVA
jgi:hypothetical protein